MKKKQLTLIGSVIVLVILVGAYFLLTSMPQEEPASSEMPVTSTPELNYLIEIEESEFNSVTVDIENGYTINKETVTTENDEGEELTSSEYSLAQPRDVNYSESAFSYAAASLRKILVDAEPVATDNHSEYGLDSPSAVVTVEHSGGATVYEIGNEAPGGTDYYAKLADNDEVWLISATTANYALNGEQQFRDKQLFSFAEGEEYDAVQSFKLERAGQETIELVPLEYDPDTFSSQHELISPIKHEANDAVFLEEIIYAFSSLQYGDIIEDDPQDYTQYGLVDPEEEQAEPVAGDEADTEEVDLTSEESVDVEEAITEVSEEDAVTTDLEQPFARITLNDELVITLGDYTDETETEVYATVSGIDSIVTFPVSSFPYLDVNYVDLMSSLLWIYNILDAESIELITPSGEHEAFFNHMVNPDDAEDAWMEPTLDGEEIEEDFVKDIYLGMLSVTLSNVIEGESEIGDIEYKFTINMLDGDSHVMEFYRINERQYGAIKDGQALPFYVNVDLLTYIEDLIADIKSGVHES